MPIAAPAGARRRLLSTVSSPSRPQRPRRSSLPLRPVTAGGFTTSASASPAEVRRGSTVSITVSVTASSDRHGLVDVEIYDGGGRKVFQRWWDTETFPASEARTFTATWSVPAAQRRGRHTINVGVFGTGWGTLHHWNDSAASFQVLSSSAPTTATTTTTTASTTTTSPTTTTTAPSATTSTPRRPRPRRLPRPHRHHLAVRPASAGRGPAHIDAMRESSARCPRGSPGQPASEPVR